MDTYNLKDILKQLDLRLNDKIDNGIEFEMWVISTALYDILGYLIEKEEKK
jgi:hypothetical protein